MTTNHQRRYRVPMTRFAYLDAPRPRAMAHRGGSDVAPENSMAAFRHAVDIGYLYLETDVHLSADGVLVAAHDADLSRVSDCDRRIDEMTWDEIAEVDLGGGEHLPRMVDLFEAFPESRFNIDPKADDAVEPLARLIHDAEAIDRVGIGSFSDERLDRMRRFLGDRLCTSPARSGMAKVLTAAYLYPRWTPPYGCVQIPVEFKGVSLARNGLIERIQALGLEVHYWTVNEADEMNRLLDNGADVIITDEADLARSVLEQRGQWHPAPGRAG